MEKSQVYNTSEEVEMKLKYLEHGKDSKKSIATGKAKTLCGINCSMEEAAAWAFDFCSKERMRISREEGNPARCVWKKGEGNLKSEQIVATVKKSPPYFITNREFVVRQFWKVEKDKIWLVFDPAKDEKKSP